MSVVIAGYEVDERFLAERVQLENFHIPRVGSLTRKDAVSAIARFEELIQEHREQIEGCKRERDFLAAVIGELDESSTVEDLAVRHILEDA